MSKSELRVESELTSPRGFGTTVLTLGAIVAVLYYGRVLFITFAFALFLALALRPFVSVLERARIPHPITRAR